MKCQTIGPSRSIWFLVEAGLVLVCEVVISSKKKHIDGPGAFLQPGANLQSAIFTGEKDIKCKTEGRCWLFQITCLAASFKKNVFDLFSCVVSGLINVAYITHTKETGVQSAEKNPFTKAAWRLRCQIA